MFRSGIANTAFHKRAMLLIFYAEYTESLVDILSYPESTMAYHFGPGENVQNEYSQKAGKRYFKTGLCKYSKCFF